MRRTGAVKNTPLLLHFMKFFLQAHSQLFLEKDLVKDQVEKSKGHGK
jgi:hypothetical protein